MKLGFNLRTDSGISRAVALLCVFLIFLTGFIAAVHFHAAPSTSIDRTCSVCALAHAGVIAVELGLPTPAFTASGTCESRVEVSHSLLFPSYLYIRPPPQA
jgi:hypothetical protein